MNEYRLKLIDWLIDTVCLTLALFMSVFAIVFIYSILGIEWVLIKVGLL